MTDPIQNSSPPTIPVGAPMGSWVLQAGRLHECAYHRVGDRLLVRPPALHHAGQSCCLVPFLRLRTALRDGKTAEGVRCAWTHCKGHWKAYQEEPDPSEGSWDPSLLEAELEGKPFLLQLPQAVALALINAGARRDFAPGEVVLQDGQANQELFLVVQGVLEVLEGEHKVASIQRGECFGELSVLTHQPTSNTVRCATACRLVAVPRDRFYQLLSTYGALGSLLNRLLAGRLRASNQQLEQILRPGIWGNLEVFPFLSVVQSIQASAMTGVLTITRSRARAEFGFDQGRLRHGQVGGVNGEDALLEIFRWNNGIFRFQSEPLQLPHNIQGETMAVLLDALRRWDEEQLEAAREREGTTALEANSSLSDTRWDSIEGSASASDSATDTAVDAQDPTSEFEVPILLPPAGGT